MVFRCPTSCCFVVKGLRSGPRSGPRDQWHFLVSNKDSISHTVEHWKSLFKNEPWYNDFLNDLKHWRFHWDQWQVLMVTTNAVCQNLQGRPVAPVRAASNTFWYPTKTVFLKRSNIENQSSKMNLGIMFSLTIKTITFSLQSNDTFWWWLRTRFVKICKVDRPRFSTWSKNG